MPIIKDKYRGKGSQTRSKFLTRSNNKAISNPVFTEGSTEQKKEILKDSYRSNPENKNQITNTSPVISGKGLITPTASHKVIERNVNGFSFTAVNEVNLLFSLKKGDSLHGIMLHSYTADGADVTAGIYWSSGDQDNISFTVSSGIITETKGAINTCLFSSSMPANISVDLEPIVSSLFKNVNQEIFFYVVSSLAGPSITYSTSNG